MGSAFAFTPFPARFVGRSTSIVSPTRAELVKVSEAEQKKITNTLSVDSTAEEVEAALAKYITMRRGSEGVQEFLVRLKAGTKSVGASG